MNSDLNQIKQTVNDCGGRLTKQRLIILEFLRSVTTHPTAEDIYTNVRKKIKNISLGTVYRNLNYLVENHYIIQLHAEDEKTHYDGNSNAHVHFICEECKKIFDIWDDGYVDKQKIKDIGIPHITICKVYGTCNKCNK